MRVLLCLFILLSTAMISSASGGGAPATRALPAPSIDAGATLKAALMGRQSTRTFSGKSVDEQTVSNLLWVANGVNRDNGKLVVPAALAKYAISLYVMDKSGIWRHDRDANTLTLATGKDMLAKAEGRGTMAVSSGLAILLVANYNTFGGMPRESGVAMIGVEAGAICQDIYLYCAASGLNAVCCGSLDREAIARELQLPEGVMPFLTMVVGHR